MSNYPVGAKNDPNAPFNKEELKGEDVGLFDYIDNFCELKTGVRLKLNQFDKNRLKAINMLTDFILSETNDYKRIQLLKIRNLLLEPQIFIEE
jgi:hypothetical protein